MLTISDAFDRILATVAPLKAELISLDKCVGLTIAEDVASDADSPPFDKSLMDGYAVRSTDLVDGSASLTVVDVITAGRVPTKPVGIGEAIQIMTGAPLPNGADVVVKVEEALPSGDRVCVTTKSIAPGSNILRRGTSVRTGDVVLRVGMRLNGSRIGALAELGRAQILVHPRPSVAVLATGDELVPIDQQPGPGQIRNSNQSMLMAQVQAAGAIPVPLGIARDNREDLRAKIEVGLQCDMLVLSGGVSAGTLDLVPSELAAAGVSEVFHKVAMKPGKPLWFGEYEKHEFLSGGREPLGSSELLGAEPTEKPGLRRPLRDSRSSCFVFGLPGNPVSSMVCFELFVRTAIRRLMGEPIALPQPVPARLEHDYAARADRPTYHPARLSWTPEGPIVTLVPWHGSSDLCGTVAANAMAFLPGEAWQYQTGAILQTIAW